MRWSGFFIITVVTSQLYCAESAALSGWKKEPAPNVAPTVEIISPAPGTQIEQGTALVLSAKARDLEDGNLDSSIQWRPALAGGTAALPVGKHVIAAVVTDSGGLTSKDRMTLTVVEKIDNPPPNSAPAISITSPANGAAFEEGTPINFSARATDAEDGDLSAAIQWQPATAGGTTELPVGQHVVTARVTDSGGLTASHRVTVTINATAPPPNTAPQISITSPLNNAQIEAGTPLVFAGNASDAEDGDLSPSIVWDPAMTGESAELPVGDHVITARVTDSSGLTSSAQVRVTVTEPAPVVDSVTISWEIPTERENGDPLGASDLAGYEIYITHDEAQRDWMVAINEPLTTSHIVRELVPGSYHFAISSLDRNRLRSALSGIVSLTVPGNATGPVVSSNP